mmetsp:Transcript_47910/g.74818  ORF Transcript_47910/g.74818 Transcript_47910/m.74818 type:complete len:193 (-) Transcript_47910:363-941(-)
MTDTDNVSTIQAAFAVPRGVVLAADQAPQVRRADVNGYHMPGTATAPEMPGHTNTLSRVTSDSGLRTVENREEGLSRSVSAMAAPLPVGNCRLYKKASMFSMGPNAKCQCGQPKDHFCHSIKHMCQCCGKSFTALDNGPEACKKHPLDRIQVVGQQSHAVHTHKVLSFSALQTIPVFSQAEKGIPWHYPAPE